MSAGPLHESDAPLKLPQFGLRTMFLVVAILGVLFAVMGLIGPLASAGLLLVLAVVGLHVAGNVVGTTLRDNAPTLPTNDRRPPVTREPIVLERDPPRPRLSERTGLGRFNRLCAGLGAVAGSAIGSSILEYSGDISVRGIVVGFISSGVLGAIFGLLFGCFLGMSLSAWWQATSESKSTHAAMARRIRLPSFPRNVTPELVAEFDAG
jgi:hypothetical protein